MNESFLMGRFLVLNMNLGKTKKITASFGVIGHWTLGN